MAKEKDIMEKLLEDYSDVFVDIVNQLVFDGKELIQEDELENAVTVSQIKFQERIHEQERDVAKYWKRENVTIALVGLENQTDSDNLMPLRGFSYDGAVYKMQVNNYDQEKRKKLPHAPRFPCITVVLYFGLDHWSGPRTLRECFPDLPAELLPFVPDYRIHVIEVAYLSPEQLGRLKSDFRFIADYLVQFRQTRKYVPADAEIRHRDETLKLFGAVTGDRSFENALKNLMEQEGKENITMCDVVKDIWNDARESVQREFEAERQNLWDTARESVQREFDAERQNLWDTARESVQREYEAERREYEAYRQESEAYRQESEARLADRDRRIRELEQALRQRNS